MSFTLLGSEALEVSRRLLARLILESDSGGYMLQA